MSDEASKLKVIITGATGMVGEGVLFACLEDPAIAQVLMVNRRPYSATHPKLKECIVPDFLELDGVSSQLAGYDACFIARGSVRLGRAKRSTRALSTTRQCISRARLPA